MTGKRIAILVGVMAAAIAAYVYFVSTLDPKPPSNDPFPNPLSVELLEDGRTVRLLNDYVFNDPEGRVWTTPKGYISDGASIPPALWSLTGGPFTGKFRNAAVIHDQYCDNRTRPWEQVHRVFYDAMIAGGVTENKAAVMYLGVYRFGPRWDISQTMPCPPMHQCVKDIEVPIAYFQPAPRSEMDDRAVAAELKYIESFVERSLMEGDKDIDALLARMKGPLDSGFEQDWHNRPNPNGPLSAEICESLLDQGLTLPEYARLCGNRSEDELRDEEEP